MKSLISVYSARWCRNSSQTIMYDETIFEPPRGEVLLLFIAKATVIGRFKLTRYTNVKHKKYYRWTSESRMEANQEVMITRNKLSWRKRRGEHASIRQTRTDHLYNN